MAATARSNRKVAPKAPTKTEASVTPAPAPAPKTSIWTRVGNIANTIAKPFKAAARKVVSVTKTVAVKTASAVKTGAKKTKSVVAKATTKTKVAAQFVVAKLPVRRVAFFGLTLWYRALRPLLRGVIGSLGLGVLIFGAIAAPMTTAILLVVAAGFTFLLARLVKSAEEIEHHSRFARIVLAGIDGLVRLGLALAYVSAATVVVALSVVSPAFAVFMVLAIGLTYFQVHGSMPIAFVAWCVLTGNWSLAIVWALWFLLRLPARSGLPMYGVDAVPEYSEIRRKPEVHEDVVSRPAHNVRLATERRRKGMSVRPSDAPNNPELWTRGEHLVAIGTEEMWGTEHDQPVNLADLEGTAMPVVAPACGSCKTTNGAMRLRTQDYRFLSGSVTDVYYTDDGMPMHAADVMLCEACYAAECEDNALAYTGVSLEKRSVEIRLNKLGIEHSSEYAASLFDPTSHHWMVSAWWRDREGGQHAREWSDLVNGHVVATVVHDYRRKVFRASALGKVVPNGVKTSLEDARRAAIDELSDEGAAVERHVDAATVATEGTPRRAKKA